MIGEAIPDCAALAEKLDAPVCSGYQHNDSFPGSHRLAVGPLDGGEESVGDTVDLPETRHGFIVGHWRGGAKG